MGKNDKKYKFVKYREGKKAPIVYFKSEEELNDDEYEMLYQDFARQWDFIPLKCKNRFMKWLRQSLEERQRKIDEQSN